MIRILWSLPVALMATAMLAGCADDRSSDRQRPAYSYENVDMGSPRPGQSRIDERPPASNTDPYSRSQPGGY
jgi:hypothetical protein